MSPPTVDGVGFQREGREAGVTRAGVFRSASQPSPSLELPPSAPPPECPGRTHQTTCCRFSAFRP
eukprot:245455-Pyramimonas_sp.AAC.1